ncbi:MAG: 6,7-dimethyl-8-ribityllumazine synthase [Dehalococcoidia bacterium]|jgi:6,7-dimethyl-8-ribityllumazine synthase|nr:6,7-dimethyl-8-ribityllumazine synthase [Dehalococcoidia bacterium]
MRTHGLDDFSAAGLRVAIVVPLFNDQITKLLSEGACRTALELGVSESDIEIYWTTGAFELPLISLELASSKNFEAICAVGAIVRGGTPHFEFVATEAARGLMKATTESRVPVSFGVLTTDNLDDAMERAGGSVGNKGSEAMYAVLHSAHLLRQIRGREHNGK